MLRFDPWVKKIPWRRKWQPTPVFLPGESHGESGAWQATVHGVAESGMTEYTHAHTHTHTHTQYVPLAYYLIHLCCEGWLGMQRAYWALYPCCFLLGRRANKNKIGKKWERTHSSCWCLGPRSRQTHDHESVGTGSPSSRIIARLKLEDFQDRRKKAALLPRSRPSGGWEAFCLCMCGSCPTPSVGLLRGCLSAQPLGQSPSSTSGWPLEPGSKPRWPWPEHQGRCSQCLSFDRGHGPASLAGVWD